MDILGRIDTRIATSIEEADKANRRASMLRAFEQTWRFFVAAPEPVEETAPTAVVNLAEVRGQRQNEGAEEGAGALATVSRLVTGPGEVMTAQQRMEQDARHKADIAHAMGPDEVNLEELSDEPPVA
jgi:hypothetical protein